MNRLSNVELMLLQLIAECGQASGYDLNKLIGRRGYREWANIGTTSVYVGLKKLQDKGLIESAAPAAEKSGKGPAPSRYAMTEAGQDALRREMIACLSATRERDPRFDLGLVALPLVDKDEAVAALRKRLEFLESASRQIRHKYEAQGGARLPLHVGALFLHPIALIERELAFVADLIDALLEETSEQSDRH
jgi:DNA-binding PadR family transcriptional regulator